MRFNTYIVNVVSRRLVIPQIAMGLFCELHCTFFAALNLSLSVILLFYKSLLEQGTEMNVCV